ncbi:perosamine synthetase [Hydrogenispora ethanolica]|uniref:Perosamine synthetase n=1 Tax=Hydrogenispora ethanolica TaxID=1082276 RepID=A0A4R1R483_HYDET|nr:DegT/DnrJ/EryC1/StrS family aminotransferase [Hydrogenispora ethanolica]TCL60275.1 perosamine synthetase [Hydrogenispora ethanolica]
MIPLSKPDITEREIERVTAVLRSDHLSCGPVIREFETKLATVAGTRYAVAVSSGTTALHLLMLALGIGPGDEVITTPYSFISSANCILYVGAKPVFCDIVPGGFNIDPQAIAAKITSKTKAILVVHVFGFPAAMDEILKIASEHGIPVIEDACEAIGARIDGKPVGGLGVAGTFAFYPNKQITTGEGGVITTNDPYIAELTRSLANQGRSHDRQWLLHERMGYNYRLNELSAALGCAQLERLEAILAARSRVAGWYQEALRDEPLLTLPNPLESPNTQTSWFVYVVRFHSHRLREMIAEELQNQGVECRPYFPAIHLQPFYRSFGYAEGDFPETEKAADTGLALPFFTRMTQSMINTVAAILKKFLHAKGPQQD